MAHYRHADELAALLSPRVAAAIEALGVMRGGFSDTFQVDAMSAARTPSAS
jgi:chitin disaccharide deacetylase